MSSVADLRVLSHEDVALDERIRSLLGVRLNESIDQRALLIVADPHASKSLVEAARVLLAGYPGPWDRMRAAAKILTEGRAALLAIAEQIVDLEIACAGALLDCCKPGEPASAELHDVHQKAGDALWMARERLHVEALDYVKRERGLPIGEGASHAVG